jgi:hypothetical protein
MAKTKRRNVKKTKKNKSHKQKYDMKGCSGKKNKLVMKKCKVCKRVHSGKHQSGGCNCQSGGNSIGLFQNVSNIGSNFVNSLVGVYNGLNAIPPPVSVDPTLGHFAGRKIFQY